MTYKCIRAFITAKGENYHYGNIIGGIAYTVLEPRERVNFNMVEKPINQSSESRTSSSLPDYDTPSYDRNNFHDY